MIIRESSNFEDTSSDQDLSDWQKDNMDYARRMAASNGEVDKRLINLYLFKIAQQKGVNFGFNNSVISNTMRPKPRKTVNNLDVREFSSSGSEIND